jgi:bifunctional UDP-N-acetylglucosamine pyrophosphorylase/glucosamine-1-phosphate N-acetyltransferase
MKETRVVNISEVAVEPILKKNWTVIIPAAGRGTRLGFDQPKILFPINGQPIIYWLLKILVPICEHIIIIVSPEGETILSDYFLNNEIGVNIDLVIQKNPTGMADAIYLARNNVKTKNVLVIWGDQVLISSNTILSCMSLHQQRKNASLTLPTIIKQEPYINIVRDSCGNIIEIQQKRELEIDVEIGENDCGVFLFNAKLLFDKLLSVKKRDESYGKQTGEFNLLQILPEFESTDYKTYCVRLNDPVEVCGINTVQDAEYAEHQLRDRMKC